MNTFIYEQTEITNSVHRQIDQQNQICLTEMELNPPAYKNTDTTS